MGLGDLELHPRSPVDASSAQEHHALPQYGFGAEVGFEQLVESNPFLFRVHTPKEPSPFYDNTEPYFVGQMFADSVSSSAFRSLLQSPYRAPSTYTYADVARHMDWTTRATSPYVSTSFSFAWAIWEATRRYHHGMKHSVEIAVIDAKALVGRAVTAVELLREGAPKDRHQDHWKWYRYALEAQDVLVYGYIPGTAVLASVPLVQLLSKLPTYMLHPDPSPLKDTPISRVAWDYERKKYSYKLFCQEMSDRFLRMPVDRRMRDTTVGAVRLALALLRPWFHKLASDDFTTATASTSELALGIARWPGLWWVREHPEVRDLVRCLVHIVGEEAREARRTQALADATRMQDIVGGLEHLARSYHMRGGAHLGMATPTVSSTASVADEDEMKADREPVFVVNPAKTRSKFAEVLAPPVTEITPPESEDEKRSVVVEPQPEAVVSAPEEPKDDAVVPATPPPAEEPVEKTTDASTDSPPIKSVLSRWLFGSTPEEEAARDYYARTASALLAGFFTGAFVTLCVIAQHRREISNHFS
ncbi:hypothetical protein PYCCODRAFT_1479116 [Trametes coccinea BRFM310]|uniref:DUF7587 domain-containing protein n=1 Tax=Trametes coccinea (strain BRFM310) TaxID=1353009 RepID=A0A1Y2IJL6_TRAC3|nr:hypothetical protein PYCCODRAFT_1479116 [Trametes coccinea BRFM310]